MVEIVAFAPEKHFCLWEEFIKTSYGNDNYVALSPDYLRWQFLENPANDGENYNLRLILHHGKVVAQLGFIPFTGISPDGSRFRGAYPINLMVRPDYRATGLGAFLLSRLLEEIPCLVNPGASEAGAALCIGLGMQDLGHLKRYICVTDPLAARPLAAEGRLPVVAERMAQRESAPSSASVIAIKQLPVETPENFSPPVPSYAAERSRAFIRWRYESHPAFSYEFLLTPDFQSILVFHEECEKSTCCLVIRVVDLLAREEHQHALLSAVVQIAKERGAVLIDFFCSLGCYNEALENAGFFEEALHRDGRIAALFQPLDFRDASIRVIASGQLQQGMDAPWYITKVDSDQDRPNDKEAMTRQRGDR